MSSVSRSGGKSDDGTRAVPSALPNVRNQSHMRRSAQKHVRFPDFLSSSICCHLRTHLCYCTTCGEKLTQRLRSGSAQHCPFCMEPVEHVIMNAAPWKTAVEREKIAQCQYCKADVPTCAAFHRDRHGKRFRASLGTQCSAGKHTCLCRECARRQLHEILTENREIECPPVRVQPAGQILIIDAPEELMTRGRRRSQSDAQ